MRIAAIDIGTNSIHMVIAAANGPDGFEVVDREREVVQIGRGSFATGRLRSDAIRRTVDALQRFTQLARRHQVDRILCTATAAVREARNGGDFVSAARAASGITPRVIPATEEGRLTWLAVKSALPLEDRPALIVDIGGGSVQLIVGNRARLLHVGSARLGALRLSETLLHDDPPSRRELARVRRIVRKGLREPLKVVASHDPVRVYGASGSIHALAHVAQALESARALEHVNGHVLRLESLQRVARRLQRMTTAEREKLPGIDAKRAEIIVAGAIVLVEILEQLGVEELTLSDFGVREGLVTDYIMSHAQEISAIGETEDLRQRSVVQCLAKFQPSTAHAFQVDRLALALFDGLRKSHGLGAEERELLHYSALLHDVGSVIGYDRHAEHSYYIIKHANLRGLTAEEVELVANIARYHGKARPRKRDENFGALRKRDRKRVRWLSAILRIAEGLDRSHYQLIRSLRVERRDGRVALRVTAKREAQLELWASRRRTDLLEKLLDAQVRISVDRPAEATPVARGGRRPSDAIAQGARRKGSVSGQASSAQSGRKANPAVAQGARAGAPAAHPTAPALRLHVRRG